MAMQHKTGNANHTWRMFANHAATGLAVLSTILVVAPLVALVKRLLRPDGECLLTDQDRVPSHVLRDTLTAEGLPFTTQLVRAGEPGGRRVKGTLYRIIRPAVGINV